MFVYPIRRPPVTCQAKQKRAEWRVNGRAKSEAKANLRDMLASLKAKIIVPRLLLTRTSPRNR